MRLFQLLLAMAFGALLLASPAFAAKATLSGQVTYRERMALPDTATLVLQLVDLSLAGSAPRLSVEAPIGPGQVPLSFSFGFDDRIVLKGHHYALVAEIRIGTTTLFRNLEPFALDPLAPPAALSVLVNRVASVEPPSPPSSAPPAEPAAPALLDVTWTLSDLGGAAPLADNKPTLLIGDDRRAGGSGSCNSWFAMARVSGDGIGFGSVTSTLRACAEPVNQQEHAFFDALAQAATWRIAGDELTLYAKGGKPLMRFRR